MTTETTARPAEIQAPTAPPAGVRPGPIMLVRHGEPALSRRCMLSARQYREWWNTYEEGGLLDGQTPPDDLVEFASRAGVVFSSTRRRAIETAHAVVGEGGFSSEVLFIEAPLPPPPFPGFIKCSPRVWGFLSRFWWWFFDHHDKGGEARKAAETRSAAAALALAARAGEGRPVVVIAHGFFNHMIARELGRLGWTQTRNDGFAYWSQRIFEKR